MKVTIKDIAREANVSIATVSRVINGKDKVKKETRLKILKAIEKYNFSPDQAARTMIMKKTKTIGLIVPLLSNEYWGGLAEVIQNALWEKGYSLIIASDNDNPDKKQAILNTFKERKVDGVILTTTVTINDENIYSEMSKAGVQFVSLVTKENVNSVSGDNLQGAIDAVNHLIKLGHKRIAYIGAGRITGIERELGYKNAILMNNLEIDNNLIIISENVLNKFSEFGYNSVTKLVREKRNFTAIFCANDLIAIGVMKACHEMGKRIPDDVAIVGFDDISIAALYQPPLTTIRQPVMDMGEAIVEMLIELIKDKTNSRVKKLMFPMELVIRESCGFNNNKKLLQ